MNTPPQSRPNPGPGTAQRSNFYRVAIVGGATLKGKEVAELLNDRNFPAIDIKLLDDDESLGQLEAMGDEVTFIQSVRAEQFDNVDFTFFASDQECTRKNWKLVERTGSTIVDLSYALEEEATARIRSPWIERELGKPVRAELEPGPAVIAHPAATVLALLALRAKKAATIARLIATIFEPASEHGQKGMDELHQQTVNLLSFQQLPKDIFDAQIAFNLITRYGDQSSPTLENIEHRVRKHYRQLAGDGLPDPSVLMVQAPIFHGYAFSIYMELEKTVAVGDLAQVMAGEHVTITRLASDSPSNVNAAGQDQILLSVGRDANHENGYWLWATADNLRVAAATAVECAESMALTRPRGKVQ
ncbi:MAG TPA: Asd/ArgC dimerization domain-containing protein [Terriglobales bacterium]|nr:Asd/ArgC dimerization domain-containing protein [Terriglobales bacterium]